MTTPGDRHLALAEKILKAAARAIRGQSHADIAQALFISAFLVTEDAWQHISPEIPEERLAEVISDTHVKLNRLLKEAATTLGIPMRIVKVNEPESPFSEN